MKKREWKYRSPESESNRQADIEGLARETGLSALSASFCYHRGFKTADQIRDFLRPKLESLTHPLKIRDMDRAVDLLARMRAEGARVRVFGDYDVDGTCGAALLFRVFGEFGIQCDVRQPDRFIDGYGLNVGAVEDAHREGIALFITVDCGISSFAACERARDLGLPVIIVDHHQIDPEKGLPPATAVLNPQRADCESGLKQLCGCGVAFYLAMALRIRAREEKWFGDSPLPNLKSHLDLVTLATAADQVPLVGDNRILVRHGLEVLKTRSAKPGMRALLEVTGLLKEDLSPSDLGFTLGPRINASGRIKSASLAMELLTTTDEARALELAREIEKLNQERTQIQNTIWDEVRLEVEKGIAEGRFQNAVVVASAKWHEGVVGIVASRVTETFRRPAIVIALREDFGKGSVRSYGGKNMLEALRASSDALRSFGGHHFAAGLSIELPRVEEFAAAFDQAVGEQKVEDSQPPLWIDGDCAASELNLRTLQEIEGLGPFGPGNPEPVFRMTASVRSHRILKGRHLKLNLETRSTTGETLEAIWFYAAERVEQVENFLGDRASEWAGVPEINRFRGRVTASFRIRDAREIRPE